MIIVLNRYISQKKFLNDAVSLYEVNRFIDYLNLF